MDVQRHNQFQHLVMQHLTKILQTTQNNNQNKHLRIAEFTQLQSNDYNDNINIPPQVTTPPPTIETTTDQITQSHASPITTYNTYYSMREQYQG